MGEIDKIVADEVVTMTATLVRAFRVAGCDPTCHCCGRKIVVGTTFKLAYIKTAGWFFSNQDTLAQNYKEQEPEDEMLCCACTAEDLIKLKAQQWKNTKYDYDHPRGYTRAHITAATL